MNVMGIDPGETTGWAIGTIEPRTEIAMFGQINGDELIAGGLDVDYPQEKYASYRAICLALMQIVTNEQVDVCVIEDFTLRQLTTTKAEGISPVRIGAMLCVWLYEIMPTEREIRVSWQTPAQAKTVVTDKRMKDLDLWVPGLPHANDAIRHVDLYRRRLAGDMRESE